MSIVGNSGANMGGLIATRSAYVKTFNSGTPIQTWNTVTLSGTGAVIPSSVGNVIVPNDLFVGGTIFNPSDRNLKQNIESLDDTNNVLELIPRKFQYTFMPDRVHYGFIAQEVEEIYPELVANGPTGKNVNYIELIPLLLHKMRDMSAELQELRGENK